MWVLLIKKSLNLKEEVKCNPAKTLYSKIIYKYAQINEMNTFSYLKDSNKVICAQF